MDYFGNEVWYPYRDVSTKEVLLYSVLLLNSPKLIKGHVPTGPSRNPLAINLSDRKGWIMPLLLNQTNFLTGKKDFDIIPIY
jgi:hypothetical protein